MHTVFTAGTLIVACFIDIHHIIDKSQTKRRHRTGKTCGGTVEGLWRNGTVMFSKVEVCFSSTETVGLLGTGAQEGHLDLHTASEL